MLSGYVYWLNGLNGGASIVDRATTVLLLSLMIIFNSLLEPDPLLNLVFGRLILEFQLGKSFLLISLHLAFIYLHLILNFLAILSPLTNSAIIKLLNKLSPFCSCPVT
ncbi:unnamed protein product [Rhizophagus irregularis]|nr:unnamed protein product [Rhizophagus irregularis]